MGLPGGKSPRSMWRYFTLTYNWCFWAHFVDVTYQIRSTLQPADRANGVAMDGLSESLLERAIGRGEDKNWRQLSSDQNPGYLLYIRPSYKGIITNHYKDPY